MTDIVICEPLRTPVGAYLGGLAGLSTPELATTVVRAVAERAGLGEGDVDDVILGSCYPSGEFPALGRIAALDAGLGVGVPGMQIDRRCGSGLQAVLSGAVQIQAGVSRLVIAGGAESMSRVEHYALLRQGVRGETTPLVDRLIRARTTAGGRHHPIPGGMIEAAENLRRQFDISREEQDRLALNSHQKAARAEAEGRFSAEIVPIEAPGRRGKTVLVDRDEHIRADASLEVMSGLPPVLRSDPEATVTAGNASGQNDGAAACVVTTRDEAERRGLTPLLAVRSWAVAAVEPEGMGLGPVPASELALERAGLTLAELDLIELNEAFAVQVLAVLRKWGISAADNRLNPNGSGISLGHPVGATGARILTTLAHELHRRGGRYALESMCIGGGQGLAAVFEKVA